MELKKQLEDNYSQVSSLVSELKLLKNKFNETKEELYEKNAENMALKVIGTALGNLPTFGGFFANKAINDKKIRAVNKLVNKKKFYFKKAK